MEKKKILVVESRDFSPAAIEMLSKMGEVLLEDFDRADLLSAIQDVNVLWIRLRNQIDKELILAAPELQYIVSPTTGLNHIDIKCAREQGVTVLSLRNEIEFLRSIRASSEHTVALMLALIRNIPAAFSNVLDGHWQRDPYKGSELHEKIVGLVGYGRIGTLVGKYLHSFGCNILATDPFVQSAPDAPYVQFVDLDQLLQESDIVSLHVSLTEDTNCFFGLNQFSLMKQGSLFINTSRGELIDEDALLHVLGSGQLAGAALDVLCDEHLFEGHLNDLMLYSRQFNNLLITPHIAGCTSESMEKTEVFMAEKLFRAIGMEGA